MPRIVFLVVVLPTILFSVTLAIDIAVTLILFMLNPVHLIMGLFHISKQQLCVLPHQGFNMGF